MSKSLGNGIDPIEVIDQYGCDAMRFTLASGSGYNRGLNLDPAQIESSRNFMNKIWNVFRFISPFLKGTNPKFNLNANLKKLDLEEKWIVQELNETAKKMNIFLGEYRFDEASSTIYSFIYDKFCSWFIELSKPVLYGNDSDKIGFRSDLLRFLFQEILKLLHPISPFITEEIWSFINKNELLITQNYPRYNSQITFEKNASAMNEFIDIVTKIRNLRASVNLKPKDNIEVHFFTDNKKAAKFLFEYRSYLKLLAKVEKGNINEKSKARPTQSIMSATADVEIFIPVADLIDIDTEIARLKKQINKMIVERDKSQKKLENPSFIEKAPDDVVSEVKQKVKNFNNQISSLEMNLENLQ